MTLKANSGITTPFSSFLYYLIENLYTLSYQINTYNENRATMGYIADITYNSLDYIYKETLTDFSDKIDFRKLLFII